MKVKLVIGIILLSITILFVYQNTDRVPVDFIAWSVDVSLALLVLVVFVSGLAIGWLLNSYLRFSRNRKKMKDATRNNADQPVAETASTPLTSGESKPPEP